MEQNNNKSKIVPHLGVHCKEQAELNSALIQITTNTLKTSLLAL